VTQNELEIETKDFTDEFSNVISNGFGSSLAVTKENRTFLLSIARELCNWALYFSVQDCFEQNLSVSEFCKEFGESGDLEHLSERGIEFLASHSFELDSSFIDGLSICTLSEIVSNEKLQLENEDCLYEMIRSHLELKSEMLTLLCHIQFEFLSKKSIENFVLWSQNHFNEFMTSFCFDLWTTICGRLSQSIEMNTTNDRHHSFFSPKCDGSLEGIIAHLTAKHGGNIDERGIVTVSSSACAGSSYLACQAVDLQTTTYFHSANSPNQWICYDFKNRKVQPIHYSIHAHSNNFYLRGWVFEGSMDGSQWDELDRHANDTTTNQSHPIGTFSTSNSAAYRYVRLRQTAKNANGNDYLVLYAFEIFGRLVNYLID
jgi:hypothetical protein